MTHHDETKRKKGYVVVTTLVFSGVFLMILYSLFGLVFTQYDRQHQIHRSKQSLQIAEAGLDWYRWYLAHNPGDLDGPDDNEPFEKTITDPERGKVGTAKLDISGSKYCGQNQWIDITSTGWSEANTDLTREVRARYLRPSVARYAYILNSNVWVGGDREISGPYHSNGGIRMEGDHNSTVSSGKENWECTDSFGCDPGGETKPGVFGNGSNPDLWDFPVPQVDFNGITLDLENIRSVAQKQGTYFGANQGKSKESGYRIVFNGDKTIDVYQVKKVDTIEGYSSQRGWHKNYHAISKENFKGTYDLAENCPVVYSADKLWIEGEVGSKVTVAAAKTKNPNFKADIVINDNIEYVKEDGAGLTAISERSVFIPLLSPDEMIIEGIFIAQTGHFGRDHYNDTVDDNREKYIKREQLSILGSIVSDGRVGTKWVDSNDNFISGYKKRINTFDRDQAVRPPPLTPFVSEDYELIRWQEVRQ